MKTKTPFFSALKFYTIACHNPTECWNDDGFVVAAIVSLIQEDCYLFSTNQPYYGESSNYWSE